jgi:hypothetical protein
VGDKDAFIVQFGCDGSYHWVRELGSAYSDAGLGIAMDPSGHMYVIGDSYGTVDFDFGSGTCYSNLKLARSFLFKLESLNVLRDDLNNNNVIEPGEIDALYAHFGSNPQYDLTGDGVVNQADVDYMVRTVVRTGYGDTNLDRKVDFTDFRRGSI